MGPSKPKGKANLRSDLSEESAQRKMVRES